MAEVTDPDLIAKLDAAEKSSGGKEVSDPDLIAKLEAASKGGDEAPQKSTWEEISDPKEWGRAAALAGRAVVEGAAGLAAAPGDAIASVYNLAKQKEPITASQFNPLSSSGWAAPSGEGMMKPASQSISEGLTAAGLPEPKTTTEKIASGVESFLTGAKVPMGVVGKTAAAAKAGSAAEAPTVASRIRQAMSGPTAEERGAAKAEKKQTKDAIEALDKVDKALKRDKREIGEASQEVVEAQKKGVPLTLADAGPNTTKTASVISQRPGEAQAVMNADRLSTTRDAKARVGGATREALDAKEDAGIFQLELGNIRSKAATENYEAVRQDSTPVMDPDIWKILEHPLVAKLYQNARNSHMEERSLATLGGKPSPPLADIYAPMKGTAPHEPGRISNTALPPPEGEPQWVRTGTAPDVKSLDYLIRSMDADITRMFKEARAGGTEGGKAKNLAVVRDQLKSLLEKASPAYKKASEEYGLDSQLMEAREYGQKEFLGNTPGVAERYVKGLTPAGQKALKVGVAEKLLAGIEKTSRNVDMGGNVLGGDRQQAVLKTLFPNGKDFEVFKKMLEVESKIHRNTGEITKGSQTFAREAAAADFEDTPLSEKLVRGAATGSLFHHRWFGSGVRALVHMMVHPSTWNQGRAEQVARILTSKNPENAVARIKLMEKEVAGSKVVQKAKRAAIPLSKGSLTLKDNPPSDQQNQFNLQDSPPQ